MLKTGAVLPRPGLTHLIASRRVILCVGCGGVGKTTTTAALGLAAARLGKRVLCLTIDPARRLAQSLGLKQMDTEARLIDPAIFVQAGLVVPGSLTVMQLDTKSTFDGLVRSLAPSKAKRDHILNNVLYKYISTSLAGTQEYMAMEKLYEVKRDASYDIILLDTPPTTHALDFLDAPERLVSAIDSPAMRWFVEAFQGSGKMGFNLLAKSASMVLKGIGKLTGSGFLEQIAAFVTEVNALFGGWKKRADEVATALRGPDVAYVLVTTPDPLCVREVLYFADRLRQQGMPRDAFVVNRVHPSHGEVPEKLITQAVGARGLALEPGAPARLRRAAHDETRQGKLDALHLIALDAAMEDEAVQSRSVRVDVPAYPYDIHDVGGLAKIAEILSPAEAVGPA